MINNFRARLIRGFLGIGLSTCAVAAPAAAMPMVPSFSPTDDSQLLTNVQFQGRGMTQRWNQQMHGNRCSTRMGNCTHYHQGYYYQTPWWTLPLVLGAVIGSQQMMNGGGGHVSWCMSRYRSYNRSTDSWLGYDGLRHRCISSY
ncbi:MAG: BA14K family protein [Aestuariivirga sp.]